MKKLFIFVMLSSLIFSCSQEDEQVKEKDITIESKKEIVKPKEDSIVSTDGKVMLPVENEQPDY